MAAPDRALRRQVAMLEELDETDRVAVLALLDDSQRDVVLNLLAMGTVAYNVDPVPPPIDQLVLPDGLSPWLRSRLGQPADGSDPEKFAVTDHCLEQLRACVAKLVPQPQGDKSWLKRLLARAKGPGLTPGTK